MLYSLKCTMENSTQLTCIHYDLIIWKGGGKTMGIGKMNITIGLHSSIHNELKNYECLQITCFIANSLLQRVIFLSGIFFSYRFILQHKSKSFCYYDYLLAAVSCLTTLFNSVCYRAWARKAPVRYLREDTDEYSSPILKCSPWIRTKQLGYPVFKQEYNPDSPQQNQWC